jgi:hypothetical protein
LKRVVGSVINVGGFALFLAVALLTRRFWWGFILDVVALWFLWQVARPAAARWTREARGSDPTTVDTGD